jgi:nicotinamide-nucleotide amidase
MVAFTAGAVLTAAALNTAFNALTIRTVTGTSDTLVLADNGGGVTYSNAAKTQMLGVDAQLITAHGAVSEPVELAMAQGALQHSAAQVALAITGVAGPGGGSVAKPVGTVWFAFAGPWGVHSELQHFGGDRAAVRQAAALHALLRLNAHCTAK